MPKRSFNVFYSWQSDLLDASHKLLIRTALSGAGTKLTDDVDADVEVIIDEATNGRTGSPNIATTIFDKISKADAFVCDLTTVLTNAEGTRRSCNPNVAIELGYAIRVLGWDRIVILYNMAAGTVDELPFDVRGHRAEGYKCRSDVNERGRPTPTTEANARSARGILGNFLLKALSAIATAEPPRPHLSQEKSSDEIRREKDVIQLTQVISRIPGRILDQFADQLGFSRLTVAGLDFYEALDRDIRSYDFHFNNRHLLELVRKLHETWGALEAFSHDMDINPNGTVLLFRPSGDIAKSRLLKKFPAKARLFHDALVALLTYVKDNYLEIDFERLEETAITSYNSR